MPFYLLKINPLQIVPYLRAEMEGSHGQPELNISAWKEYEIEEEFDYAAYGVTAASGSIILVTSRTTLAIEPRIEQNYWILEAVISQTLGPVPIEREYDFSPAELTLTEFEKELKAPGDKQTTIRLNVETPMAKQHFDDWLADMRHRHPDLTGA